MKEKIEHQSVLLNEILNGLNVKDNDVVVDMTLGGAGHLSAIAKTKAKNLTLIGIDADSLALSRAKKRLGKTTHKIILANTYFDNLEKVLVENKIPKVDKVLFDLGLSSFELDDPKRGFSFKHDGPLKMTYADKPEKHNLTAYDVVNDFSEENLASIIYGFGEEKFSRRIAKAIVTRRQEKPIETTKELADLIYASVPGFYQRGKIHPATKTFQAIRIAVNSELERLKIALNQAYEFLTPNGRIAVISFHSLEDRIVKRFFREKKDFDGADLITKKPITPTLEEIENNPRARSAKLRIIEK